jgi:sterol desaturase/sphingolipid hydroxylase (fatty acid hydroxylase superfamily)
MPILDFLSLNINELGQYLFDANKRIYLVYLISAALLAIPVYLRTTSVYSVTGFIQFILPWRIYSALSARHDYALLIGNKLIKSAIFPLIVISMVPVAINTSSLLEVVFGYITPVELPAQIIVIIFTVLLFVADDFTRFLLHYLLHNSAIFWEFHKVHHSAQVLTPFTIYRSHPVESLLYAFRMALTQGIVVGCCYYFFGATLEMADILGANLFVFLFNFFGSNLRHSHIWLSWGDTIEGIFISPAQHQIHHSADPKHFNSNYGSALACWDSLFNSLIKSSTVNTQKFTIGGNELSQRNLGQIYFEPFINASKQCSRLIKKQLLK